MVSWSWLVAGPFKNRQAGPALLAGTGYREAGGQLRVVVKDGLCCAAVVASMLPLATSLITRKYSVVTSSGNAWSPFIYTVEYLLKISTHSASSGLRFSYFTCLLTDVVLNCPSVACCTGVDVT